MSVDENGPQELQSDASVQDVAAYGADDPDIRRYVHRYRKAVPETIARQQRVARKWLLTRDALHDRMRWSRERVQEWQLHKLSTLVDIAFNTIPFYRDRYSKCGFRTGDIVTWDDFASLPIITRHDLTVDFPTAQVLPGVDTSHCYGARTSGSSGVPLSIVRDDGSEELQSLLRMRQFEVMLGERLLPADWIYNIYLSTWAFTSFDGDFRVFSVSEDCPPSAVVRHIRRLRPKIISAFPSFVSRMMALPQDLSRFGVRCICTNSEGSTRQERNAFAEAFGVPVFDEYSTEELCGVVASECVKERYHIVEDRVVVEVANTGLDRVGDIIATDLANFYMPIIRYSQGDLIGLADESTTCDCGNSFRYFDKLLGRGDQALNSPAIGRVPGDRLMNLLDRTLVSYESGVAAFRVVQVQHDAVDVLIVLRSGVFVIDANIWDTLTDGLRELFEYRITITLRYLNALPDLGSHKRRSIVNEVHLQ